jgi:multiple sugar transport system substrate-binding protein
MKKSTINKIKPGDVASSAPYLEMSSHEMDRFLDFISNFNSETQDSLDAVTPIRELEVVLTLMRSHLHGRLETPSSLIAASGHSRGTAHRMIETMIEDGLILRRPRTKNGKSFSLHPSPKLIEQWLDYAHRMKLVIGTAFGLPLGTDYFFGASYLSASVIPPLPVQNQKLELKSRLRMLLHADPTFLAMNNLKRQLELHFGIEIETHALSIDRLRKEILIDSQRKYSRYDIVTADLCWMAEFIEKNVLLPIGELGSNDAQDLSDFHPEALATVKRENILFGLPVQTTPELFIYRKDVFEAHNLQPPTTLEDVVASAKILHESQPGMSGICWNGARGTPVGTTFMMLMADLGQSVINLPRIANSFSDRKLLPEHYRPALDTPEALRVAEILLELRDFSPPNVLQMSWYERAQCYADGKSAMTYCYTQIVRNFEENSDSPAYGKTGYCLHPSKQDRPQIAPLGGWNLCVPANIKSNRIQPVTTAVQTLTSAAVTKLYIENGSMVSSRFSVCNDPSVAYSRPIISDVDRMARAGSLKTWPRPAIAELTDLVQIIGDEVHSMLLRNKPPKLALSDCQNRCDALMRSNDRY